MLSSDFVTILTTPGRRLAKIIRDSGEMIPYDDAAYFTHMRLPVHDLDTLHRRLEDLRKRSDSCVIRGTPLDRREAENVVFEDGKEPVKGGLYRRRLELFPDTAHYWLMLDVDDASWTGSSVEEGLARWVVENMPPEFHDVSFVWHLSSSAGIKPGLRAHLWFWASTIADSRTVNEWAKAWNTAKGRRVLDTSIYNPVQVHYTSDPVVDDTFGLLELPSVRMGKYVGFMGDTVQVTFEPTNGPSGPTGGTKEETDEFDLLNQVQPLDDIDEDKAHQYLQRIDNESDEGLSYDDWLKIGMALKHQFGDDGLDLFLEFSERSPKYDEADAIRRYKSFHANRRGAATFSSIIFMAGGRIEPTQEEVAATFESLKAEIAEETDHVALTGRMVKKIAAADIPEASREVLVDHCRQRVKKLTGTLLPKGRFLEAVSEEVKKNKDLREIHLELGMAKRILDSYFPNGRLKAIAGNFWCYQGGVWVMRDDSVVRKYAFDVITDMLDRGDVKDGIAAMLKENDRAERIGALVDAVVKSLRDQVSEVEEDPLGLTKPVAECVVNCLNGEVWFNNDGTYYFREHDPSHNLTQQLSVHFDEDCECPTWDAAVEKVFRGVPNAEAVIRYWYEIMGYLIQPTRDAGEAWVLMKGPGGNGKSFLLEIIQSMLGQAATTASIADLAKGANDHFSSTLVGKLMLLDDDFKAKGLLPDDWMKKLTGQKTLQANPKYAKQFNFICRAAVVILSNGWPSTSDVSDGMRRRANVFEVNHVLTDAEKDPGHRRTILTNELPGVLNRLLEGWARVLKNGGRLRPPQEVISSRERWMEHGSTALRFVREAFVETFDDGDTLMFKDVWNLYKRWIVAYEESSRPVGRHTMMETCASIGMKPSYVNAKHRSEVFRGWRVQDGFEAALGEATGL